GPNPHGPNDTKVNRKVAALAFRRALYAHIADGKVAIIDALPQEGKTKAIAALVKAMGLKGRTLFVTAAFDEKVELAVRNIPTAEVLSAKQVDVYSLLQAANIVATPEAFETLKARMGAEAK
ncbi:MAG: 50S ribosomal protein L4, partial [Kiritimatiellae bacterium]|nr:50S ribosomal protein L4 [Kiritimatiellia bacterium]